MKLLTSYDVGIYCRLSRDDGNSASESMSIGNQRQLLTNYVLGKGWNIKECYCDDGFTGTNFDRPNFQRMIRDAEAGKINCVITTDLSRLGRNYVKAGYYTEEYFVERGIRFIAINDSIDTMQDNNDIAAFHHVLNEFYPKQVSKKVRQVKRASAMQGKFMNSQAPYGFDKSPADKHILVVDECAARIVRRLFEEYAGGESARGIANHLNADKVDSPRFYRAGKQGRREGLPVALNVWGSATVTQMLQNQAYIGNMVQGKRQVVSFKTKRLRGVDPEDWIIVEGTHMPLVSRELWDRVQARFAGNHHVRERKREKTVGLFAGVLRCADCGSPLAYMRKRLKNSEKGVYRCSRYNNNGVHACTGHYIEEADVAAFVLDDIRRYAILAANERELLANRLMMAKKQAQSGEMSAIRAKIRIAENRLGVIASALKSLYVDKALGKLPEAVCLSLMGDFMKEQVELEEALPKLYRELDGIQTASGEIEGWLSQVEGCLNLETLDRATVMGLIERITVSERVKLDGKQTQALEICYRFIGNLPQNADEGMAIAS